MKRKKQAFALAAAGSSPCRCRPAATTTVAAAAAAAVTARRRHAGEPWILGTTDTVTALDPAGSYDLGSSTLQYNLFQTLVTVPANSTEIVGDAAESCDYDDPQTLTCTLKPGLKFSNGDDLTSSDVKYSFERAINIQDPNGAAIYLLGSITHTDDDGTSRSTTARSRRPTTRPWSSTSTKPDTTFQYVLTYPGAGRDRRRGRLPGRQKLADEEIIGSGPYKLSQYKAGEQAVLETNEEYTGDNTGQAPQVFVKYYSEPSALKLAAENGEVDVAWRSLSPTDIADLEEQRRRHRRHRQGLGDPLLGLERRRRRSARSWRCARPRPRSIDRDAIAQNAYDGTVDPLYSIVPPGYAGQKDSFQETYGDPDPRQGQADPRRRRHHRPRSKLTVGWTPTHYGPNTEDEANEVKRQLEDSGLFKVDAEEHRVGAVPDDLQGGRLRPLDARLVPGLPGHRRLPVAVHGRRWLLPERLQEPRGQPARRRRAGHRRRGRRARTAFGQLQDIAADDVPFIPSWVGQEHRRLRRRDDGRRGHARPVVHLPLLARQQERLTDTDRRGRGELARPGRSPRRRARRRVT